MPKAERGRVQRVTATKPVTGAGRGPASPSSEAPVPDAAVRDDATSAFDAHVQLLADPRFSNPADTARIVVQLQAEHGNSYVERVVDAVRAAEAQRAAATATGPAPVQRTPAAAPPAPAPAGGPPSAPPKALQSRPKPPPSPPRPRPKKPTAPVDPTSGLSPGAITERRKEELGEKMPTFKKDVGKVAGALVTTAAVKDLVKDTDAAAKAPKGDAKAQAGAAHVDDMAKVVPGVFDEASFVRAVKAAIGAQAPKNLEEAVDFGKDGKGSAKVSEELRSEVKEGKSGAAGEMKDTARRPLDLSVAKEKQVVPLAERPPGPMPAAPAGAEAMPGPVPASELDLSAGVAETAAVMTDADVTDEMLANSGEPGFVAALRAKQAVAAHAASAPPAVRRTESKVLSNARAGAADATRKKTLEAYGARTGIFGQVFDKQQGAKTDDEAQRLEVVTQVNLLYAATSKDVKGILTGLDSAVDKAFTDGEGTARKAFDTKLAADMKKWKSDRYGGFTGKIRWVKDKLGGLPKEVDTIFAGAKDDYVARMDKVIKSVARVVTAELQKAVDRIALGRQQVHEYVASLPVKLRAVGVEAEKEIGGRFNQLNNDVADAAQAQIDDVARRYKEAARGVDTAIEKVKEKHKGLVAKAVGDLVGTVKVLNELRSLLMDVLGGAISVIKAILTNPVQFYEHVVHAVVSGAWDFVKDIPEKLFNAIMKMIGAISRVAIPSLDLKGLFGLLAGIFGMTRDRLRGRLVNLIGSMGEKIVSFIERGVAWARKAGSGKAEGAKAAEALTDSGGGDTAQAMLAPGQSPVVQRQDEGGGDGGPPGGSAAVDVAEGPAPDADAGEKVEGDDEDDSKDEAALTFMAALEEGPGGLMSWGSAFLGGFVGGLLTAMKDMWDAFIEGAKDFLLQKIIRGGVEWLAGLLGPVAGVLKAVKTLYDFIKMFLRRLADNLALAHGIVDAVKAVAGGTIGVATKAVTSALTKFLPTVIDFFATAVGVSEWAGRIKGLLTKVQTPVLGAADKVLKVVARMARRLYGKRGTGEEELAAKNLEGGTTNVGYIAVTGPDLSGPVSWNWSTDEPPTADQATSGLKGLSSQLSGPSANYRDEAFRKAEEWIQQQKAAGGLEEINRRYTFFNDYLPKEYKGCILVIFVKRGRAFS